MNPSPAGKPEREFARIAVAFQASILPVDEDLDARRELILRAPSVWSPSNENALREMVAGDSGEANSRLAQAILDLSAQLVRLQTRMEAGGRAMTDVRVIEISGGGGQIEAPLPLQVGDRLEMRFDTTDEAVPPIRALIEILHTKGEGQAFGFRFDALHPADQDRLIRWIYQLQRVALRNTGDEEVPKQG